MGHVILARDPQGTPSIEEADTLESALEIVERLRNGGEVEDVRLLREIPLEVRTYYKVVVADAADPEPSPAAGGGQAANGAQTGDGQGAPDVVAAPSDWPSGAAVSADPPPGSAVLAPPSTPPNAPGTGTSDDAPERRGSLFGRS